jgi:hypothetical protein
LKEKRWKRVMESQASTQRAVGSDTAEGTENTTMLAQMEEVIKRWLNRVEEDASGLTF